MLLESSQKYKTGGNRADILPVEIDLSDDFAEKITALDRA